MNKLLAERFWGKVLESDSGCWEWTGYRTPKGYGRIGMGRRKPRPAHRVMWELIFGKIPSGKQVLHECDNPSCVHPFHVYLGTNLDNVRDKVSRGRQFLNNRALRGEEQGSSKLTRRQVLAIRSSRKTLQKISEQFGVSKGQACRIRLRKQWSWL